MAWVDEEISVFLAKHEFGSECYRFTRHSSLDSKQQPQSGAAGGAIIFDGKVMLLGSDNFLRAPKERESELLLLKDCSNDNENDESDSDNYERNNGDDNDDTAIRLFKSMRVGGIHDVDVAKVSDINNSDSRKRGDGNLQKRSINFTQEENSVGY
ncbi:hypothetical protein TrVFT333_008101 [Trichoderma virens FT-333]|nr:hypothetical protein TrVFT333_008101 [Trichoderma virens FT-333]